MIRLLIVDDEPYTVDGLNEMLSDKPALGLDLYSVYSTEDARQRLTRTKIDIVLCDIRMPGMNGLELQKWIQARWPRCKVIFLTGIGDVTYVQQAIRGGGVDYILKTEGDEAIIHAIHNAISKLEEEAQNDEFILKAKDQVRQALPLLRRNWFTGITDSDGSATNLSTTRFEELELPLSFNDKVMLLFGRVDKWRNNLSPTDKTLFANAIQNIAEEYLRPVSFQSILLSDTQFIWFVQPKHACDEAVALDTDKIWNDTIRFVIGMLESVQTTCKSLLQLSVSFVTTGNSSSWEDLPRTYQMIKNILVLGLGNGEAMLITHCDPTDQYGQTTILSDRMLSDLRLTLESGLQSDFNEIVDKCFDKIPNHYGLYTHSYYSLAVLLLEQINKSAIGISIEEDTINRLMDLNSHASKETAISFLKEIALLLFSHRLRTLGERTNRIIHRLNQHIRDNLNSDLSLDALADLVYLNSSYLSTLYKQYTCKNISDYIAELRVEKAKELLACSQVKIHEIASTIGFGTAGYFTRFFKKHVGITPQEFRNSNENLS